ncbi:MAG: hypothetical protein RIS47_2004 [Bacteroidota bacterium]
MEQSFVDEFYITLGSNRIVANSLYGSPFYKFLNFISDEIFPSFCGSVLFGGVCHGAT